MNIVVCIKQVPDTSEIRIDNKTNNLIREGVPSILNPFDENGVETALSLRDRFGGKVTVISMGPPQAEAALRQCLEMGADEAILLSDKAVVGSDTLATGYILSAFLNSLNYDLVICGNEAIDGCTGQVGPIIAGNLDITQFTYVRNVDFNGKELLVCREVGAYMEHYRAQLPCLLCVLKDSNTPRLRGTTDKKVTYVSAEDIKLDINRIGNNGSPTKVVKIDMSNARGGSYFDVDDSLPWEERIEFIIRGGMECKEKVNLWRGTADVVAKRLVDNERVSKYLEV